MARMTRDDLAEMRRCNARPGATLVTKRQEQDDIERQVQEFIARGGKIVVIPTGLSGDKTEVARSFQAAKGGAANGMRIKGTLGMERAARHLGVPQKVFSELVAAGMGPAPCTTGKKPRWVVSDLDAWASGAGVAA